MISGRPALSETCLLLGALVTENRGLKCLGAFCSGNATSKNGEILINFSEDNNLKMSNTFYKKKLSKKWTWQSLDGKTKNEIDYCLVNDMNTVKDVSVQ